MASAFGWLDHSEQQRRQMLEIVDLFREKGTLDELGVGQIRDAFADRFFPGTSTLHTRARYLLFVPWILTRLERKRVPSAKFDEWARWDQAQLVKSLVAGGESTGVIGITARASIQTPPSAIYWSALRALGIMRFPHTYGSYLRSLDGHYRSERGALRSDDGELVEASTQTWHTSLPPAPSSLFEAVDFDFTRDEAEYIQERIVTQQPNTLLSEFSSSELPADAVDYPWQHPAVSGLPTELRSDLAHAERFSLLAQGAYLVYNVMLAEAAVNAGMTAHEGASERYRDVVAQWSAEMTAAADLFTGWDVQQLWRSLADFGRHIPLRTRHFIETWTRLALEGHSRIADDTTARRLIEERERQLKHSLARLQNRRALENWGGDSSTGRLSYRWRNARQIIVDVRDGLDRPDVLDA